MSFLLIFGGCLLMGFGTWRALKLLLFVASEKYGKEMMANRPKPYSFFRKRVSKGTAHWIVRLLGAIPSLFVNGFLVVIGYLILAQGMA